MAIDDSTSYELTGAQVKDLANKIKGKAADNIFVGATSSAPGSKGLVPQPQAGDDAKFLSGDGSWQSVADNYSTAEQETGTTWIDSKPIYRKTVRFGVLPNASAKSVPHNITNLDHFVKVEGIAWTSTKAAVHLPFASPNQLIGAISLLATSTGIDISTGNDRREFANCYITLWYTKTTD